MKRKQNQSQRKELKLKRRVVRRLVDLRKDELDAVNGGAKETNNWCMSDC